MLKRIVNLMEVDEDVFNATIEFEDGSVIVYLFHGREAIRDFLMEGTNDNDANQSRSKADRSHPAFVRH